MNLRPDIWYHVTILARKSKNQNAAKSHILNVYFAGESDESKILINAMTNFTRFGNSYEGNEPVGLVKDVRLYGRILNKEEILGIAEQDEEFVPDHIHDLFDANQVPAKIVHRMDASLPSLLIECCCLA
eukprot:CAMPEP_0114598522 /NCGR_PEP_ID=MMETSP0125-20121206/20901_1 /TAXON_ID=485358 ORGANISM="Aristerostoma sp., Strain ATCC 50986" /NCGR_SAMPLE_ID=MMETSP0125 /ASSEMBLY_ACC=CAM_ASM_000245 /LENGTH=128 /DNA_ID=CAMNT_0001804355 /DNA_START=43 /DNA_END=429 /DNA_ORIENTATION=+